MLHIALTAAQVGPVPGETLDDLRIIAAGLMADGIDVSKLSNIGKVELRQAIDRILALAATAQVGEAEDGIDYMLRKSIANRNATIECCALVCDELARAADSEDDAEMFRDTSTRIRALKDKP
jgi:hypothetical protein